MKKLKFVLLMLIYSLQGIHAQTEPTICVIGTTKIIVPTPEEFVLIPKNRLNIQRQFEVFTPSTARLLTAYILPKDLASSTSQGENVFSRYVALQTVKEYESYDFSDELFQKVLSAAEELPVGFSRAQLDEIARKYSNQSRAKLGSEIDIRIGEVVQMGVFSRTKNSLSFAFVQKTTVSQKSEPPNDRTSITTATYLRLKQKVLFVLICTDFDSALDIDWVKDTTDDYVASILALNS